MVISSFLLYSILILDMNIEIIYCFQIIFLPNHFLGHPTEEPCTPWLKASDKQVPPDHAGVWKV